MLPLTSNAVIHWIVNGWGVTYTSPHICALKGSTVDISCTYTYPTRINGHVTTVEKTFWFIELQDKEAVDLRADAELAGRVQYLCDLRNSDSAVYKFMFITNQQDGNYTDQLGVILSVQVIWSSTGPKLICHSNCFPPGHSTFVWYKNETRIQEETFYSYRKHIDPAGHYSCAYKGHCSLPRLNVCSYPPDAPKVPLVLMSSSGEIMRGSSVTLTCSSDADPAATYTWYKENQTLLHKETQLILSSIQSSDSGEYYCTAENELGQMASKYIFINVKYGPEISSLSASPSAKIVEGSSVNLTCSSDANPAATYTWYKENQTLLQGPEHIYHFTSISSEDRGTYYCKSENLYGEINSTSLFLDVQCE
uniref:Ig-like domain-containing protein n=1 Tax=Amphiprion percula TaxID=161767 RepID=A0A3P8SPF8_AMPPE